LTRPGGATIGRLRLVTRDNGISLVEAARRSAMVDILANQEVLADVADVINTEHGSWTNFLLEAQVGLPRARRAVTRKEEVGAWIQRR
jgi:hypothetical protein